jgi:hypothetical protein
MMVTRAQFQARFEAPPRQVAWTRDYDGRAAAALKAATSGPSGAWQGVASFLERRYSHDPASP